jgi:adenosylmethionine-8-amino-7-oxononanoate aminotransferase
MTPQGLRVIRETVGTPSPISPSSAARVQTLAKLDQRYIWHPFTQMRDWLKREPIVIVEGQGAVLRDTRGREYLDANSSIWTNLHGHRHPQINAAIQRQLKRIAHSSALGLANGPASLLAQRLVILANDSHELRFRGALSHDRTAHPSRSAHPKLAKVFFSDDGSTAIEVALKLAYEFSRRAGHARRPRFLSLQGAYHGDTVGATSLGHIDLFHKTFHGLLFKTDQVMAPYCYRCPFNRARPERADARSYRKCNWECLGKLEQKFAQRKNRAEPYAGFIFEPLIQGAAGMIPQPKGWLARAANIARAHGTLLIADEVLTFGRTGGTPDEDGNPAPLARHRPALFASHREGVQPDFLALAKGLTGGYLPMAATLTTQAVFDAFLGAPEKAFFHGHSFTGNQLGAAAALASLEILQSQPCLHARTRLEKTLKDELDQLWTLPQVGDIRQVGLIAGVELIRDWTTRRPFDNKHRAGARVCEAMAKRGVLTRPIGDVVVLMPPYCCSAAQIAKMVESLSEAIQVTL